MEHIAHSDFLSFFTKPNRPLHARVAGHLFGGCAACLTEARQVLREIGVSRRWADSRALAIVTLEEAAYLKDERARAAARWARIANLEERVQLVAVQNRRGLRNYGLAVFLLEEAETSAARRKGANATALVKVAAAILSRLPANVYGAGPLADLELRYQTTLCNIRRLQLDFPGALKALESAAVWPNGADPAERARFFRVKASLLYDLGHFEAAAKAARRAVGLYAEFLDFPSKGRANLQEAMCVALFDPRTALGLVAEALPLLATEPKSLILASFWKCYCLLKLERTEEAEKFLASQRELIRQVADVEPDLWFKYIDALIMKAKGNVDDADSLLQFVALRFREEGMFQAMLFQHLERIRIKAATGRWKSAVNIATRLTPELARLGLRNDLLGMWASLQDALSQRRDVVSEIEDLFRRRWNAPGVLAVR